MTMPFSLPDWVPWWVQLVILVAAILVAGAFVLMPFSVFGVKARLDTLDLRLDELQADLRDLALRLPDPEMRRPAAWRRAEPDDDGYYMRPPTTTVRREDPATSRRDDPTTSRRDDPTTSRRDDPQASRRDDLPLRPPIPPAPMMPERERASSAFRPRTEPRAEPQLRWPSDRD